MVLAAVIATVIAAFSRGNHVRSALEIVARFCNGVVNRRHLLDVHEVHDPPHSGVRGRPDDGHDATTALPLPASVNQRPDPGRVDERRSRQVDDDVAIVIDTDDGLMKFIADRHVDLSEDTEQRAVALVLMIHAKVWRRLTGHGKNSRAQGACGWPDWRRTQAAVGRALRAGLRRP